MIFLAILIAIAIPLLFLYLIYALDLHSSFNQVVNAWSGTQALVAAMAIGLGGVGLIALFIRGLRELQQLI